MTGERTPEESERTVRARRLEILKRSAIQRAKFQDAVMQAINNLSPDFRQRLENVDIVVADWPTPVQLARNNVKSRYYLLGLYEGIPHTRRGQGYGMVLPDKITIFRKPIETRCHSWEEVEKEVGKVVRHEIAHHFGIEEHRLQTLENEKEP
jgi:predicted Zn-dependent protease with MMP-like domain